MKEDIERWGADDGVDVSRVDVRYEDLGRDVLGVTRCRLYHGKKGGEIGVSYRLEKSRLARYGTLWHEYSHFYAWVIYGTYGHGTDWLKS